MDDSRIKDVSSLLSAFFDADKLKKGEAYADFFSSWAGIVGSRLAAHSRIADIDKGLVIVEAEHPGWIQLLQLRQSSIVEELSARYPEFKLRGVVFRLKPKNSPAGLPKAENPVKEEAGAGQPEEQLQEAAAAPEGSKSELEALKDPAFKKLMDSLKSTIDGRK